MTEIENKSLSLQPVEENEIDLIQLAKEVWNGRKLVIKTTIIFIILGLLVAFLTPEQYSVTSIMVPQSGNSNQSKLGGLSSLAAMAGFNLNLSNGADLNPMIYPQIVHSIPFQKDLMQTKLDIKGVDHPVTYYDYYTKYSKRGILSYITGFPGLILQAIRGKSKDMSVVGDSTRILRLTLRQRQLAEQLSKTVFIKIDQKNGSITLVAIMPQALAAAQLGLRAQELLQQFITSIKIKKAKEQMDFIQERFNATKVQYDSAQIALAHFRDQNKNISTAIAQSEEQRLSDNYHLIYGVYSELAKQLENARIQVKDDSPVFSIIEPITIPNLRLKPKRSMILAIWTFLGIFVGVSLVFGVRYWKEFRKRWEESDKV
ncbi:MAG: lipopolysaccharide biosynthesis protein [Bacteroidales bacterium]|nr:lipopolysaccharide biosynthesis protein [Bacteroidales bacterium]